MSKMSITILIVVGIILLLSGNVVDRISLTILEFVTGWVTMLLIACINSVASSIVVCANLSITIMNDLFSVLIGKTMFLKAHTIIMTILATKRTNNRRQHITLVFHGLNILYISNKSIATQLSFLLGY